ncbi:MAG: anaerobic sulfatase maturase [Puniceicoccaceae bacterium]
MAQGVDIGEQRASQPFHIMTKPIGPKCNLDCQYCFYLEKEMLFGDGERWKMNDATLEAYIKRYIEAQPADPITFAWQGGEPTLCGVDFFEKVVHWQKQYGLGRQIDNAFQTNGTLLDDEWCSFLKREKFLVGLSIDGPREMHDAYRVTRKGKGTFDEVMRGLEYLKKHKVDFNTLTCVNRANQDKGPEVYAFLKGIGSRYLQFIPIVERLPDEEAKRLGLWYSTPPKFSEEDDNLNAPVTEWSVQPKAYGRFMWSIFKRWVQQDVGRIYVQLFDVALGKWANVPGGLCVFEEECGRAMAIEHDGSLYSCDHYVYPEFKLGNINEQSMTELVESDQQKAFGRAKKSSLPQYCRDCEVRFACNGGCPKQRFILTPDDEPGLHYLCSGYKFIFTKMDPYMKAMAELYHQRQSPAGVMQLIKQKRLPKPA